MNIPYTLRELWRKTVSRLTEKTDQELYFPAAGDIEVGEIQAGGNIVLTADISLTSGALELSADTNLNLSGKTISATTGSAKGDTVVVSSGNVNLSGGKILGASNPDNLSTAAGIRVTGNAKVTLTDMEITGNNPVYILSSEGAEVIIKSGTYTTTNASQAVYVGTGNGKVIIEGGTLMAPDYEGVNYTLNIKDSNPGKPTDYIEVKGGTFIGFNPAESMSEPGGPVSFLSPGYKAEKSDNNTWIVYEI